MVPAPRAQARAALAPVPERVRVYLVCLVEVRNTGYPDVHIKILNITSI